MRLLLALALLASLSACKRPPPAAGKSVPFSDDFERMDLGPDWVHSGGHWEIEKGAVHTTGADNAPLFLKVDLPADVVVELDVESETQIVDAKIELMTDGRTHASGYIFILGGWGNTISCIARLDEHGTDRKERRPTGVTGPRRYHWRVEKKGGELSWYIDGQLYMSYSDPRPLDGPGHNRLSFSNWRNTLRYDNLRIWPLASAPAIAPPDPAATATRSAP